MFWVNEMFILLFVGSSLVLDVAMVLLKVEIGGMHGIPKPISTLSL